MDLADRVERLEWNDTLEAALQSWAFNAMLEASDEGPSGETTKILIGGAVLEIGSLHRVLDYFAHKWPSDLHHLEDCLEDALDPEVKDFEIEEALKAEGIYTWGPDGERFERMFAIVMKSRHSTAAALRARKDKAHEQ